MSQENVELFRRSLDAFNRGDVEAWLATIHPDVTFAPIRASVEGAYRGHAGIRRFFAENQELLVRAYFEAGDREAASRQVSACVELFRAEHGRDPCAAVFRATEAMPPAPVPAAGAAGKQAARARLEAGRSAMRSA